MRYGFWRSAMLGEPSRRFTVLDAMALVAAVGIGLALARAYQWSMDSANAAGGVTFTYPLRIRWFGRPAPLLASLTLTLIALRFVGPRPRYRRLVGSPGFAACFAPALGLAITGLTALMDIGTKYLGYSRSPIYFHFLAMRSVTFAAPSVAGAWVTLALLGRWYRQRDRDWVDLGGIVVGVAWLMLLAATQLNV
jgi:hypothetical protein